MTQQLDYCFSNSNSNFGIGNKVVCHYKFEWCPRLAYAFFSKWFFSEKALSMLIAVKWTIMEMMTFTQLTNNLLWNLLALILFLNCFPIADKIFKIILNCSKSQKIEILWSRWCNSLQILSSNAKNSNLLYSHFGFWFTEIFFSRFLFAAK